jgi:hypothetical protein
MEYGCRGLFKSRDSRSETDGWSVYPVSQSRLELDIVECYRYTNLLSFSHYLSLRYRTWEAQNYILNPGADLLDWNLVIFLSHSSVRSLWVMNWDMDMEGSGRGIFRDTDQSFGASRSEECLSREWETGTNH